MTQVAEQPDKLDVVELNGLHYELPHGVEFTGLDLVVAVEYQRYVTRSGRRQAVLRRVEGGGGDE